MNNIQTSEDLEYKLLDEHGDKFNAFTKLILTLSTASIGVLTAFQNQWINKDKSQYIALASIAIIGLLVSFLSGVLLQHFQMMRPRSEASEVKRLTEDALKTGNTDPIQFRRIPNKKERVSYRVQITSFYLSILSLVAFVILNINSANQQVEPTVKTPSNSVNAVSTEAHP